MDVPGVENHFFDILVNNLDLTVAHTLSSTTHFPNGRNGPDNVNNVEKVRE